MNMQHLLICLILCELFEFFWQKGDTFRAYIQNLLDVYNKGLIYFICLHLSFFFMLFCIFGLHLSQGALLVMVSFKFVDIGFKISLLNKLQNRLDLGNFTPLFEQDFPLSNFVKLTPLVIYVALFSIFLLN